MRQTLAGGSRTMTELKDRIKQFIMTEVNPDRNLERIGDDEPLVDSGIVDSLGVLKIMAFLDEECGIDLSTGEIKLQNFNTVASICHLVDKSKA
jgi:acyl carrier protein